MCGGYDAPSVSEQIAELAKSLDAGDEIQAGICAGMLREKLARLTISEREPIKGGRLRSHAVECGLDPGRCSALLSSVLAIEGMIRGGQIPKAATECRRALTDWEAR